MSTIISIVYFLCAVCALPLYSGTTKLTSFAFPDRALYYLPGPAMMHIFSYNADVQIDILAQYIQGWQEIKASLESVGYTVRTSNLSELHGGGYGSLQQPSYYVFENLPVWLSNWRSELQLIPKNKRILCLMESRAVMPYMYTDEVYSYFDKIFTCDDTLVDDRKFFKMNYPVLLPLQSDCPPFSERRFLTQISGNKHFSHPDELYTERRNAIAYFENNWHGYFDFYGVGWEGAGFRNYKGAVASKYEALKKYKFALCYENVKNVQGYITEKVFDCFASGCVPIYWGADNVTDHIPKNCFIDRRKFASHEELMRFLVSISEDEWNEYLTAIRSYLKSREALAFSKTRYVRTVLQHTLGMDL